MLHHTVTMLIWEPLASLGEPARAFLQSHPTAKLWIDNLPSKTSRYQAARDLMRYCGFHNTDPETLLQIKKSSNDHDAEKMLDEFVASETLIKLNGKFEFLGWWKGNCDTWHLDQPLERVKDLEDNMVLLRRRYSALGSSCA